MKVHLSPKTLHLLIKADWLFESITNLGGGYLIHLAYGVNEIDPKVLSDIQNQKCGEGVLGNIIQMQSGSNRPVASFEVIKVKLLETGYRFELRILEVVPYFRKTNLECNSSYLCHYSENPA